MAAVPNIFGTRDRFRGRQFFLGGEGGNVVQAVMRATGSGRWSFTRSPPTHLLLCGSVPNRLRTSSGPRPGVGDPCSMVYKLHLNKIVKEKNFGGFPGGAVVGNPPANAGDTGSIPGPGRSHMPGATKPVRHNYWACALEPVNHNYWACVLQLLKPACLEPVLLNKRSHRNERSTHRNEE